VSETDVLARIAALEQRLGAALEQRKVDELRLAVVESRCEVLLGLFTRLQALVRDEHAKENGRDPIA
jgi:hypothetical protein